MVFFPVFDIANFLERVYQRMQRPQRVAEINFFNKPAVGQELGQGAFHQSLHAFCRIHRAAGAIGPGMCRAPRLPILQLPVLVKTVLANAMALQDFINRVFTRFIFMPDCGPIGHPQRLLFRCCHFVTQL